MQESYSKNHARFIIASYSKKHIKSYSKVFVRFCKIMQYESCDIRLSVRSCRILYDLRKIFSPGENDDFNWNLNKNNDWKMNLNQSKDKYDDGSRGSCWMRLFSFCEDEKRSCEQDFIQTSIFDEEYVYVQEMLPKVAVETNIFCHRQKELLNSVLTGSTI